MKKILALFLVLGLVLGLAACGGAAPASAPAADSSAPSSQEEPPAGPPSTVTGGWNRPESYEVTEELRAVLDKALAGKSDLTCEPLAYLAYQIVAGRNHAFFCRTSEGGPEDLWRYAVVYVYEDLGGGAEITGVEDMGVTAEFREAPGGWFPDANTEIPPELREAVLKSAEGTDAEGWEPLAIVAEQVVAGMNYCLLCEIPAADAAQETAYGLEWVFVDLQGGVSLTDFVRMPA